MPQYNPPPLDKRVRIRNPSAQPPEQPGDRNTFGILVVERQWGDFVWAHRRDQSPRESIEENVIVQVQRTVWTIRKRSGLDSDVEIVHAGEVFQAFGPPVIRGGYGFGRVEEYMEIHTRRRT